MAFSAALLAQGPVAGVFGQIPPGLANAAPANCAADGMVVNSNTGEPIVRAVVSAASAGPGGFAVSDAQGRWSLTGITCGRTQISAQKQGFIAFGNGQNRQGAATKPLQLVDGSPAHDVKVALTPQSVILGKVIDENGDPIQGAQIQAMYSSVVEGKRQWQMRGGTQTNDLGEYRMHGLFGGKYIVCAHGGPALANFVQVRGGGRMLYQESCYPGSPEGTAAGALSVLAGIETRVDFTIRPTIGLAVRGTITGLPAGERGVGLQLRRLNSSSFNMQPSNSVMLGEGRFELSGVAPGSYILNGNVWRPTNRLSGDAYVEVGNTDVEGVTLGLLPGFPVTGVVRMEIKAGSSTVQRAPVTIRLRSTEGSMENIGQIKWSDDNRSFTMPDVMPSRYRIEVIPNGAYFAKSVTLAGQSLTNLELNLQQATGPIEIVLSDDTGSVQGTISGPDGKLTSGAVVLLSSGGGRPINAFAGPDGNFTIPLVPPGKYQAYSWSDAQQAEYANPDWLRQFGSDGVEVTVAAGQAVKIELKQKQLP